MGAEDGPVKHNCLPRSAFHVQNRLHFLKESKRCGKMNTVLVLEHLLFKPYRTKDLFCRYGYQPQTGKLAGVLRAPVESRIRVVLMRAM